MANTARRGNSFELVVAKAMEAQGFVVASRRHVGGAGDLLGVHPDGRIWLCEVKASRGIGAFRRAERQAMLDLPLPPQAERWVALKDKNVIKWVKDSEWPCAKLPPT